MKISDFRGFLDDIRNAYCTTKQAAVENIFIKLSQSLTENFYKWLRTHREIRGKMADPVVYDALNLLIDIRKKYPAMDLPTFVKNFVVDTPYTPYVPYLMSFANIVNNSDVKPILDSFGDILNAASRIKTKEGSVNALPDIMIIKNAFDEHLESRQPLNNITKAVPLPVKSKREKLSDMFANLVLKFSKELSSAAHSGGQTTLADALNSGLLLKQDVLSKMGFPDPTIGEMDKAREIIKDVMRKPDQKNEDENYITIKIRCMSASGELTRTEVNNFLNKSQEQSINSIFKGQQSEPVTLNIEPRRLLDEHFIATLSYAFRYFYFLIGKLR